MFKYKLKKGVSIDVGTAFKYKSIEDLKSLLYAIGESDVLATEAVKSGTSLKESGYLILSFARPSFSNSSNFQFEKKYIVRKYLVGSDEHVVRKKDFFTKKHHDEDQKKEDVSFKDMSLNSIQMANSNDINNDDLGRVDKFPETRIDNPIYYPTYEEHRIKNNREFKVPSADKLPQYYKYDIKDSSLVELLDLLRNKAVKDKQYEFAAEIRDIESRINKLTPTVLSKGVLSKSFEGSTLSHESVNENANANCSLRTIERLSKIDGVVDNDYTKLLKKIIYGEDFVVELSDINNCFNSAKEDKDENSISILKFVVDKYIKDKNIGEINIDGFGSVLVVNKKTFEGSGGPQGFFDMLYKLKTIVIEDEQFNHKHKNLTFEKSLNYIYKDLILFGYTDGSKKFFIKPSDKGHFIDFQLLKDFISKEDAAKIDLENIMRQYASPAHGYEIVDNWNIDGKKHKVLIKPDRSVMIIE